MSADSWTWKASRSWVDKTTLPDCFATVYRLRAFCSWCYSLKEKKSLNCNGQNLLMCERYSQLLKNIVNLKHGLLPIVWEKSEKLWRGVFQTMGLVDHKNFPMHRAKTSGVDGNHFIGCQKTMKLDCRCFNSGGLVTFAYSAFLQFKVKF